MINYRCIEVKDKEEIYEILLEMRDYFLDGIRRTNQELYEYADKLAKNAHFKVTYEIDTVVSFVAYYANDYVNKVAFIIMIAINSKYQKGITGYITLGRMLDESIKKLKHDGFYKVQFEVDKANTKAIALYNKHGAIYEKDSSNNMMLMYIDLTDFTNNNL